MIVRYINVHLIIIIKRSRACYENGVQDQNQGLHKLRKHIVDQWEKLDQRVVNKAVGDWRTTSNLPHYRRRTVLT